MRRKCGVGATKKPTYLSLSCWASGGSRIVWFFSIWITHSVRKSSSETQMGRSIIYTEWVHISPFIAVVRSEWVFSLWLLLLLLAVAPTTYPSSNLNAVHVRRTRTTMAWQRQRGTRGERIKMVLVWTRLRVHLQVVSREHLSWPERVACNLLGRCSVLSRVSVTQRH